MQTRSFSKTQQISKTDVTNTYDENIVAKILDQGQYSVDIDFDEASAAWRANKKPVANGTFKYICCGITKTGNKCNRQPLLNSEYCKTHTNKN